MSAVFSLRYADGREYTIEIPDDKAAAAMAHLEAHFGWGDQGGWPRWRRETWERLKSESLAEAQNRSAPDGRSADDDRPAKGKGTTARRTSGPVAPSDRAGFAAGEIGGPLQNPLP